jgi:hypothetical protein
MKIKRNQTSSTCSGACLLKKIANESDGKVVIASAKPAKPAIKPEESNWGHNVSIMPCAETPNSAMGAIDTLPIDRTNIFGVCIHHTDTETADKARKALKSKNYSTHFLIDKNGDTTVELPLGKRAAACVGFNKWMWQIDVVGRLHINEPTRPQLLALENLLVLLACGRNVETIDKKFAAKCRAMSAEEVQKETPKRYTETYNKYHERAVKKKSWHGVLDKLPFTIFYHGEVRPTACCGKNLINKLPQIISNVSARINGEDNERVPF